MLIILKFLLAIIVVEGITNIITKSMFFSPIREFFFNRRKNKLFYLIHDLLDCSYCFSVWAGWFVCLCWFYFDSKIIDVVFIGIVLHRLSNVLHFIIDWLDKKRPRDLNFNSKGEDYEWIRKEHDTPVVSYNE